MTGIDNRARRVIQPVPNLAFEFEYNENGQVAAPAFGYFQPASIRKK